MTNEERNDVLEPSSTIGPGADAAGGLPAGYAQHLRDRRDRLAGETIQPAFGGVLAAACSRAESGTGSAEDLTTRRGRRPVTILSAAAVAAVLLVGAAIVVGQRNSPLTVEMAEPGATTPAAPGPTDGSAVPGSAGAPVVLGLEGVPLLFPPGPADQMQAQIGADPEIEEPQWTIDGGLETFIAGTVDQPARLVTVMSVPISETEQMFGLLNMPSALAEVRNADDEFSVEVLKSAIRSAFGSVDTSVQISEMDLPGLTIAGRLFDVWMKRSVELPIDSRLVVIPTETATTVVMASSVDRDTLESVVQNLVIEGDLLRAGVAPDGFDRLGERTTSIRVRSEEYVVIAPPSMGPNADPPNDGAEFPSRLTVYPADDAAGMFVLWASRFAVSAESMVLRQGPDWVLGTLDPTVAFGVRDGVWMSVGDHTIRALNQSEPDDGPAAMMDGLRDLWDGVHTVDHDLFERALRNGDEAADRRAARVTTTTAGGPGD